MSHRYLARHALAAERASLGDISWFFAIFGKPLIEGQERLKGKMLEFSNEKNGYKQLIQAVTYLDSRSLEVTNNQSLSSGHVFTMPKRSKRMGI